MVNDPERVNHRFANKQSPTHRAGSSDPAILCYCCRQGFPGFVRPDALLVLLRNFKLLGGQSEIMGLARSSDRVLERSRLGARRATTSAEVHNTV